VRRVMNPQRTLARKSYPTDNLESSASSAFDYTEGRDRLSPLSSGLFDDLGNKCKHKNRGCSNQERGCQP
jgi:hypothetical protein